MNVPAALGAFGGGERDDGWRVGRLAERCIDQPFSFRRIFWSALRISRPSSTLLHHKHLQVSFLLVPSPRLHDDLFQSSAILKSRFTAARMWISSTLQFFLIYYSHTH